MKTSEFAVVIALARCGIAHEPPNNAFLQQLRRMAKLEGLSDFQRGRFQALLDWHNNGRERGSVGIIQSSEDRKEPL